MQEILKDIVGYEGLYKVSNLGYVKGKKGILKPYINLRGYYSVCLVKHNKPKTYRLHRIVAQAFIPNPDNKPQVNHIDGDKSNNKAENLEWCTQSENMKHAFRIGLCNNKRNGQGIRAVSVAQLDKDNNIVAIYASQKVAGRINNISPNTINACLRGVLKTGGGYKWAYIDDGKEKI